MPWPASLHPFIPASLHPRKGSDHFSGPILICWRRVGLTPQLLPGWQQTHWVVSTSHIFANLIYSHFASQEIRKFILWGYTQQRPEGGVLPPKSMCCGDDVSLWCTASFFLHKSGAEQSPAGFAHRDQPGKSVAVESCTSVPLQDSGA